MHTIARLSATDAADDQAFTAQMAALLRTLHGREQALLVELQHLRAAMDAVRPLAEPSAATGGSAARVPWAGPRPYRRRNGEATRRDRLRALLLATPGCTIADVVAAAAGDRVARQEARLAVEHLIAAGRITRRGDGTLWPVGAPAGEG